MNLHHGGNLTGVARQYGIPLEDWLDLSTGISPISYPIPELPRQIWRQLPHFSDTLIDAAKSCYGASDLLPVPGSQSVIQLLPDYIQQHTEQMVRVWLPFQGYKEHEKAWRSTGAEICHYCDLPDNCQLQRRDVIVVINPNNPSGNRYSVERLLALQSLLSELKGWLIVDEAFMDACESEDSVVANCHQPNLVVLRSIGKFYGLAGIRLGFLCAHRKHIKAFLELLGPWCVNGPAQFIAEAALRDRQWQHQHRQFLANQVLRLNNLLSDTFATGPKGTNLFRTVYLNQAKELHEQLCRRGIYVRLTDEEDALRFGIPDDNGLQRLQAELSRLTLPV